MTVGVRVNIGVRANVHERRFEPSTMSNEKEMVVELTEKSKSRSSSRDAIARIELRMDRMKVAMGDVMDPLRNVEMQLEGI